MLTQTRCYLLDESEGVMTVENGRQIKYHNARFYDLDARKIFKAKVSDDSDSLPEEQVHVLGVFYVDAREKFCSLFFDHYEAL